MRSFKQLGIIGFPSGHSLSPFIHKRWLTFYDIDGDYEIIESSSFEKAVWRCHDSSWWGLNVTIPHKEAAYSWADECDLAARSIKAVNCLFFGDDGKKQGFNTDAGGFAMSLDEKAPLWRDAAKDRAVLMFGAGGVARGILYSLMEAGFRDVRVVNRTLERAESLRAFWKKEQGNFAVFSYNDAQKATENVGLIINASSLGMKGFENLPISLRSLSLPDDVIVFDSIYTPLKTHFLEEADYLGLVHVGGLGMLVHQARLSFLHWFGVMPKMDDELYSFLHSLLKDKECL